MLTSQALYVKCYKLFSDGVMIAKFLTCEYVCVCVCVYVCMGLKLIVVEYNYSFLSDMVDF